MCKAMYKCKFPIVLYFPLLIIVYIMYGIVILCRYEWIIIPTNVVVVWPFKQVRAQGERKGGGGVHSVMLRFATTP